MLTPFAAVGPPQVIIPGRPATLLGDTSSGEMPLTYSWTQLPGSPTVTLSDNNTVTAHSPRFTTPTTVNVFEFSLVVTDRFGRSSTNLAVARVAVGSTPLARFTPDGGVFFGGQTITFQSQSIDDGGLALRYEWTSSGSVSSVVADGGPTAYVTFAPVTFMAPDELGTVDLRVTNSIGSTSAPFSRTFVVRGGNPNNWSIDAGNTMTIAVTAPPLLYTLFGSVAPVTASPLVSWNCAPSLPLISLNSLTPQFVAPVISGPTRTFACSMTAIGAPPLSPTMLTTNVAVIMRDAIDPELLSTGIKNGRMSPFGSVLRLSEPIDSEATVSGGCTPTTSMPPRLEAWGSNALVAPRGRLPTGALCSFTSSITDKATPPRTTAALQLTGPASVLVEPEWVGPWVSSADFEDPRPVVASMGPFPKDELARWNPPLPAVQAFEVVGREGTNFIHSLELDPLAPDAGCGAACSLSFQSQPMPQLTAGLNPPNGNRVFFAGGSLFVSLEAGDGGLHGELVTQRDRAGVWQPPTRMTGAAFQVKDAWSQIRVDGGTAVLQSWDTVGNAFVSNTVLTNTLVEPTTATGSIDYLTLVSGPTRSLTVFQRVGINWVAQTNTPAITNVVRVAAGEAAPPNCASCGPDLPYVIVERSTSPQLQVLRIDDFPSTTTVVTANTQGWSFAVRGGMMVLAYSLNGDVRLAVAPYISGGGVVFSDFGGPPRPGFPSPPVPLDLDVLCEAAYPSFAFIEDALVITWQERCAPETRWKIAARVIR